MTLFAPGIFKLSIRQLIGKHRLLLLVFLVLLSALPALISLVVINSEAQSAGLQETSHGIFEGLILSFILPVIALLLSGSVLREEIQSQTINYLVLKPSPRAAIVLSKWSAAALIALILGALCILSTAAVFGESSQRLWAYFASGMLATLAYGSFYLLFSLAIDRVLIGGFVFLILWEGIIGGISKPASLLSVRVYVKSVEQALLNQPSEIPLLNSVLALAGIVIFSLALASWRLSRMEFPGSSE